MGSVRVFGFVWNLGFIFGSSVVIAGRTVTTSHIRLPFPILPFLGTSLLACLTPSLDTCHPQTKNYDYNS